MTFDQHEVDLGGVVEIQYGLVDGVYGGKVARKVDNRTRACRAGLMSFPEASQRRPVVWGQLGTPVVPVQEDSQWPDEGQGTGSSQ